MDSIHKFMNIVVAPIAIIALAFFLPTYRSWKGFLSTLRTIFSEDVAGKVILITEASSGIGEYARRGACLALVGRRENRLRQVAAMAELIGSPDAIIIPGDVTRVEECEWFVDVTVKHFGRLDHLVTNAGVAPLSTFEDVPDITNYASAMDINFWGTVYSTYYAVPHLKRSKGRIIAISSVGAFLPAPRLSFYNASKAAAYTMYETLRVELGSEIGITIVAPGLIQSEMTAGKFLNPQGKLEVDEEMRNIMINLMPAESTTECAKAIVNSACRGEKYLVEPAWYRAFYWKVFCPDIIEWSNRLYLILTRSVAKSRELPRRSSI